jgi:hypothetical protein
MAMCLMVCKHFFKMNISATEKIFRELSQPKPPQPQPAHVPAPVKQITLTREDVTAIIRRTRGATPEELQHILDYGKELGVSEWERSQISVDMTIAMAARSRQGNGRREDPNAQFIAQVLGYAETPYGLIEREWINAQLRAGSQAIQRCKLHRPPECRCWSASRATLWQARASGEKTPQGWAAVRIYAFLEDLELASRPEIGPERSASGIAYNREA